MYHCSRFWVCILASLLSITVCFKGNSAQAGRYGTKCSIQSKPLVLPIEGKFRGQRIHVGHTINPVFPIFRNKRESLNTVSVLYLNGTNVGV